MRGILFCPLLDLLTGPFLSLPPRITYVQSTPGVPSPLPLVSTTTGSSTTQQALPVAGSAYVPSALATLGFTAIAPPGQTLVQPLITGQGCHVHNTHASTAGAAASTGGRNLTGTVARAPLMVISPLPVPHHEFLWPRNHRVAGLRVTSPWLATNNTESSNEYGEGGTSYSFLKCAFTPV